MNIQTGNYNDSRAASVWFDESSPPDNGAITVSGKVNIYTGSYNTDQGGYVASQRLITASDDIKIVTGDYNTQGVSGAIYFAKGVSTTGLIMVKTGVENEGGGGNISFNSTLTSSIKNINLTSGYGINSGSYIRSLGLVSAAQGDISLTTTEGNNNNSGYIFMSGGLDSASLTLNLANYNSNSYGGAVYLLSNFNQVAVTNM